MFGWALPHHIFLSACVGLLVIIITVIILCSVVGFSHFIKYFFVILLGARHAEMRITVFSHICMLDKRRSGCTEKSNNNNDKALKCRNAEKESIAV